MTRYEQITAVEVGSGISSNAQLTVDCEISNWLRQSMLDLTQLPVSLAIDEL